MPDVRLLLSALSGLLGIEPALLNPALAASQLLLDARGPLLMLLPSNCSSCMCLAAAAVAARMHGNQGWSACMVLEDSIMVNQ
jgi:hypothetical protein